MLEGSGECEEIRHLRWVLGTSLVTSTGDMGLIPGLERSHCCGVTKPGTPTTEPTP